MHLLECQHWLMTPVMLVAIAASALGVASHGTTYIAVTDQSWLKCKPGCMLCSTFACCTCICYESCQVVQTCLGQCVTGSAACVLSRQLGSCGCEPPQAPEVSMAVVVDGMTTELKGVQHGGTEVVFGITRRTKQGMHRHLLR